MVHQAVVNDFVVDWSKATAWLLRNREKSVFSPRHGFQMRAVE